MPYVLYTAEYIVPTIAVHTFEKPGIWHIVWFDAQVIVAPIVSQNKMCTQHMWTSQVMEIYTLIISTGTVPGLSCYFLHIK